MGRPVNDGFLIGRRAASQEHPGTLLDRVGFGVGDLAIRRT